MTQSKPSTTQHPASPTFARTRLRLAAGIAIVGAIVGATFAVPAALAQYDPSQVFVEAPAIAAHFPDPDARYPIPSLAPGRNDFASHQEVFRFGEVLSSRSRRVKATIIGRSQQGRSILSIVLVHDGIIDSSLPTVMIIAGQHGDEPAASEAALAIADRLATVDAGLLEGVNVLIVPRANPDASEMFRRASANGIDVDRDHLLLRTPEGRAIAETVVRYRPQVIVDLHDFAVRSSWHDRHGALARYDALVHASMPAGIDPELARISRSGFVDAVQKRLRESGFSSLDTDAELLDRNGRAGPTEGAERADAQTLDHGSDIQALRPAISLRIDVRGADLGRAHLLRRVHAHVQAAMAAVTVASGLGSTLVQALDRAGKRVAAAACSGPIAVDAAPVSSRPAIEVLDAKSGDVRTVEIEAAPVKTVASGTHPRLRPCGYLVSGQETGALENLRKLGVNVERVRPRTRWSVGRPAMAAQTEARKAAAAGKSTFSPVDEWFYVPLDQPAAGWVVAALEPGSQNAYAAHGLLDPNRAMGVTKKPSANMLMAATTTPPVRFGASKPR